MHDSVVLHVPISTPAYCNKREHAVLRCHLAVMCSYADAAATVGQKPHSQSCEDSGGALVNMRWLKC
jgi:hypothetical protein